MKFRIETWNVAKLLNVYREGSLDLNPLYQRRFIWSLQDQRILIESISNNYPIPNIFLLEKSKGKFEIVDGQQRTRTLISFFNGDFKDFNDKTYSKEEFPEFETFEISVIIIYEIAEGDISIEEFYGLVNSAGVHLNRPEIKKAEYYDTRFLKLINNCNSYHNFKELKLFTDAVLKRMNDMDFVSELLVLLKDGITDKKEKVDKAFEEDVSEEQYQELELKFKSVSDSLFELNKIYPIRKTRYKQRNDFYTMFGFFSSYDLSGEYKSYIYQILVLIGGDISPSNEDCLPFQDYARNCITQSNSKNARQERQSFFEALFLNENSVPNLIQKEVLTFYKILDTKLTLHNSYYTFDLNVLKALKPSISFSF